MIDNCPVCGRSDTGRIFDAKEYNICRCKCCGMVFLEDGTKVYSIDHYDYYKDKLAMPRENIYTDINETRYRSILKKVLKYKKSNQLLDIGCGTGHFVKTASGMGWSSAGIEVAPYAVRICKDNDINVMEMDALKLTESDKYDVVTIFEVVEHLPNPIDYIKKTRQLLRQGGCMIITTPNFNSITRLLIGKRWRAINKEHLFYFTPKTLCSILKENGFKIKACDVRNVEPHEILKLFKPQASEDRAKDQALRTTIEHNMFLRLAKHSLNALLNVFKMGETIFLIAEKV